MRLNILAMFITPYVGRPRFQMCVGGLAIILMVQSPALLTIKEKPFWPGSGMVAKLCHSIKGESERRTKLPSPGVAE